MDPIDKLISPDNKLTSNSPSRPVRTRQRGVALLVALIITTIAIVLASAVVYRQQLHIRLTGNLGSLEQAYQYALGMEDWASTILETDYRKSPKMDSLDEAWATLLPPIPIPGGSMNGQLFDLQSRINLNLLNREPLTIKPVQDPKEQDDKNKGSIFRDGEDEEDDEDLMDKPPGEVTPPPGSENNPQNTRTIDIAAITTQRLENLIRVIDPDQELWRAPARNFPEIVKDWIDADDTNGNPVGSTEGTGSGAESPYYQSLQQPYYSANTALVSPTELRLLKDVDAALYNKLSPLVSTLPPKNERNVLIDTPININTATADVLRAIGFDEPATENIIKLRSEKQNENAATAGIAEMSAFLEMEDVKAALALDPPAISTENLALNSNFFLLQGSVNINNTRLFLNSVLYRQNGKVSVIMRDFSNQQAVETTTN